MSDSELQLQGKSHYYDPVAGKLNVHTTIAASADEVETNPRPINVKKTADILQIHFFC